MITFIFDNCDANEYGVTANNIAKGFKDAIRGSKDVDIIMDKINNEVQLTVGYLNDHNLTLHIELTNEEMEDIGK